MDMLQNPGLTACVMKILNNTYHDKEFISVQRGAYGCDYRQTLKEEELGTSDKPDGIPWTP